MSRKNHWRILPLVILFVLIDTIYAQPLCHFKHYSTEDGLPQYTIMDMIQDQKGFMWFGTWDGLSKFDGYRFKNYKVHAGDTYFMRSNRIERIYEDKFNRIWMRTYDNEFHCFNPATQKFWGTQLLSNKTSINLKPENIMLMPSGKVWVLLKNSGCIVINDSDFNYTIYDKSENTLKAKNVFSVFEDKAQNSWLLTDNGIGLQDPASGKINFYFYEKEPSNIREQQAFYAAAENKSQIMFASVSGRVWCYQKKTGKFRLLQLPTTNSILKIDFINSDNMLFITDNDGFILHNLRSGKSEKYNQTVLPNLHNNKISLVAIIDSTQLWFDTEQVGIYKFDFRTRKLRYYSFRSDDASTTFFPPRTIVFKDINNRIWVQPKGGGFSLYNPANENLDPFYNSRTEGKYYFSNLLHSACSDKQGNLWMCTRSHGLEKIIFDKNSFKIQTINNVENSVVANDVRCVFEDSKKQIWVATKDSRLTIYDYSGKRLGNLDINGKIVNNAYLPAIVYSMYEDKKGNYWIGTKGSGLIKLTHTNKGFAAKVFRKNTNDLYSISENSIYSIFQDNKLQLWIGTYAGGLNLVQESPDGNIRFINHRNHLKNYPIESAHRLRYITQNKQGLICLGSTEGLIMFSPQFSAPENIRFKSYTRKPGDAESLTHNDIHEICITRKGEMFLATFGGGINKVTEFDKNGYPLRFKTYTTNDGLPSDVTLSITEDEYGKLWISSENNLSKLDPDKQLIENFAEVKRMLKTTNFSEASNFKLRSNEILLGFSNGIIRFSPKEIKNSTYKPYIAFTELHIFNKKVDVNTEKSPLKQDLNLTNTLELTHNQNFISIEYAALDYTDPENIQYAYKLEGLDKEWNYVQKQRIANYTNLSRGKYVFKVKSTNSEGVWSENTRELTIEIKPSFWETPLAFIFYLMLVIAIIFIIVKVLYTIYKLKGNVELEKKMSEMKLRFFTDISHEIRTPLTMITAPVDYLLNDSNTSDDVKKHLKGVSQNTNRMLRLVNQILDFRKIQFLHLKVQEIVLADYLAEFCENFDDIIHEQHIKFSFENNAPGEKIWVDVDCLEKISMNLLSNAFKYTAPGKQILVRVHADDKQVSLTVADQGAGISKDVQKKLFVRFASFNLDKSKPSTGIGLSLVKELADKHAATITVESEEGKGSSFTVSFLRGIAHFSENTEILAADNTNIVDKQDATNTLNEQIPAEIELLKQSQKPSILVIEDDTDLRKFICSIIEAEYVIFEAVDGRDGWEKAQKICPDFIVSDIMMPHMDGVELLQKLKSNKITSHIPVVLLTAKTTIESKLEGLSYGADDYITKPFSVPYFRARIANLLQQRKQLQELFRTQLQPSQTPDYNPQPYAISSHDEQFMSKIMALIEENMENTDFTVEEMGQNMLMSRSVFFKKVKALTGLAPVEFIRDMKMKRAAQLLSSNEYMVKEVSYLVGISDTKYFAKCFKAKFGLTPVEYRNKEKTTS